MATLHQQACALPCACTPVLQQAWPHAALSRHVLVGPTKGVSTGKLVQADHSEQLSYWLQGVERNRLPCVALPLVIVGA